jgi:hypothetical protein
MAVDQELAASVRVSLAGAGYIREVKMFGDRFHAERQPRSDGAETSWFMKEP